MGVPGAVLDDHWLFSITDKSVAAVKALPAVCAFADWPGASGAVNHLGCSSVRNALVERPVFFAWGSVLPAL